MLTAGITQHNGYLYIYYLYMSLALGGQVLVQHDMCVQIMTQHSTGRCLLLQVFMCILCTQGSYGDNCWYTVFTQVVYFVYRSAFM